ncbi:hypothetical protein BJY04DRAFT_224508 [Aspergillus karnatakaensis]|uniref:uncharacterized protein n=1 Tax=Aspergillus karnatakaensis TaxID=1810916 RepID=UPI003CCD36E8
MSTTTSAPPAASTCTGAAMYELPQQSAACGVPNTSKYEDAFNQCALPAGVRSYHDDCALWAPAVEQSVQDLIDCLYGKGVEWGDVWCSGGTNATASGSYATPTVEVKKDDDKDDKKDDDKDDDKDEKPSKTGDADKAEETGDGVGDDTNVGSRMVVGWGALGVMILGFLSIL